MSLSVGGYRNGDDYIHLMSTKKMENIYNNAKVEVKTAIPIDEAKQFLKQFGASKKALGLLPKAGNVDYIAAHGGIQLMNGEKPIFTMVKSLKNPILTYLRENLPLLLKRIR